MKFRTIFVPKCVKRLTVVDINIHVHDIILKNNVFVPEICKPAFMRNKNIVEICKFQRRKLLNKKLLNTIFCKLILKRLTTLIFLETLIPDVDYISCSMKKICILQKEIDDKRFLAKEAKKENNLGLYFYLCCATFKNQVKHMVVCIYI